MYNERIAILDNAFQALTPGDPGSRQRAMPALGNMTDISDDENSRNFGAINTQEGQREVQMTADFVHRLRGTSTLSSSSGRVNRVADDLHAMIDEMGEEESAETRSERALLMIYHDNHFTSD